MLQTYHTTQSSQRGPKGQSKAQLVYIICKINCEIDPYVFLHKNVITISYLLK